MEVSEAEFTALHEFTLSTDKVLKQIQFWLNQNISDKTQRSPLLTEQS